MVFVFEWCLVMAGGIEQEELNLQGPSCEEDGEEASIRHTLGYFISTVLAPSTHLVS